MMTATIYHSREGKLMEYDEYEVKPSLIEQVVGFLHKAMIYGGFALLIGVIVATACRIAAHVEDRSAADQWNLILQNQIRSGKI